MFRKKVPIVLQIEAAECGAASLAMVLGYHGRFVDLDTMRDDCRISRDGSRLSYLMEAAKKHGMKPRALKVDSSFTSVALPAVAFWRMNHFIVVEHVHKGKVYLCDPARGRLRMDAEDFAKGYSGICLELQPTENFEKGGEPFRIIPALLSIVASQRKPQIYLTIVSIALSFVGLVIPGLTRAFIDDYLPSLGSMDIAFFYAIFASVIVFQALLLIVQLQVLKRFEYSLSATTSARVVRHALRLPVTYFLRRSRSALVQKIATIDALSAFIAQQLAPMAINSAFALVYLMMMIVYSPPLALLVLFVTGCVLFAVQYLVKMSGECAQRSVNEQQHFFGVMVQNLRLFDTMKATASEDKVFDSVATEYANYTNANQASMAIAAYMNTVPVTVPLLFQVIVLGFGGMLVLQGQFTVGLLLAFQSIAMSFFAPLTQLIGQFTQLQSLVSYVKGVNDIVGQPLDPLTLRDAETGPFSLRSASEPGDSRHNGLDVGCSEELQLVAEQRLEGRIELSGIAFGYNPNLAPVVSGIDVVVEPGRSVAFVGGSGSGKSTIVKLVLGLYQAQEGTIRFDSKTAFELPRESLALSMAAASQVPSILSGTVRENITFFDDSIDQTEVIKAAQDACIHDDITRMPNGYASVLDESGGNISGGQRQRIMIARALANRPNILILDEATSALDTLVEKRIMENIRRRSCTVIIVAHRLSTIRDCDEIVVLEKGVIVERGSHQALMEGGCGHYRNLVSLGVRWHDPA